MTGFLLRLCAITGTRTYIPTYTPKIAKNQYNKNYRGNAVVTVVVKAVGGISGNYQDYQGGLEELELLEEFEGLEGLELLRGVRYYS